MRLTSLLKVSYKSISSLKQVVSNSYFLILFKVSPQFSCFPHPQPHGPRVKYHKISSTFHKINQFFSHTSFVIQTSLTTARKINNDLSKVIIMTQIMTQSNENTDLILTHFTNNNDLSIINAYFLVITHYTNAI